MQRYTNDKSPLSAVFALESGDCYMLQCNIPFFIIRVLADKMNARSGGVNHLFPVADVDATLWLAQPLAQEIVGV